jgi:hypothetical protein
MQRDLGMIIFRGAHSRRSYFNLTRSIWYILGNFAIHALGGHWGFCFLLFRSYAAQLVKSQYHKSVYPRLPTDLVKHAPTGLSVYKPYPSVPPLVSISNDTAV